MKPQPNILKIKSNVSPFRLLIDKRRETYGIEFGTVTQVARQYGVTCDVKDGYVEFSGPKTRLQMFVEKLHFSEVPFSEVD